MSQGRTKYEFWKEASLSQKLANQIPIYQKLAGSDAETSEAIGTLLTLGELGYINLKEEGWLLIMGLLDMKRKARFATSDKVNEITKMGLQMPKSEDIITDFDEG